MTDFPVIVGSGTLRSTATDAITFPHRWTEEGVTVDAAFTGAHLLHLAAAGCVLNDIHREATALQIEMHGVRVSATGGFDTASWRSTGIGYSVHLDTDASRDDIDDLLRRVDVVAEIPRAIRAGAQVERLPG